MSLQNLGILTIQYIGVIDFSRLFLFLICQPPQGLYSSSELFVVQFTLSVVHSVHRSGSAATLTASKRILI